MIVSRDDPAPPKALVIYVPLTTQNRNSHYEIPLPKLRFLEQVSLANVQGIGSLPTVRLERKLGELPAACLEQIKVTLAFALNLRAQVKALTESPHRCES